jgi:hypothetical protein
LQEKKPKGFGWVAIIHALALSLFVTASSLDLVGRLTRNSLVWTLGAHAATTGIGLALGAWVVRWWGGPRRGRWLWLVAILTFGLARFLRGAAGVSPDPPLIGLEGVGVLAALAALWRGRSATGGP